jgi:hypothetical protein
MRIILYISLFLVFTSCATEEEGVTGFWILDQDAAKIGKTVISKDAQNSLLSFGEDYYYIFTDDLIIYMEKDGHGGEQLYYEIEEDKLHLYQFRAMQKRKEKVLIITMHLDLKTNDKITVSFNANDFADDKMASYTQLVLSSYGKESEMSLTFNRSINPPYGHGKTEDYNKYFNMNIENAKFNKNIGKAEQVSDTDESH